MDKQELAEFVGSFSDILSAINPDGGKLCGVCAEIEPTVIARVTLENDYDYVAELCDICVDPTGVAGLSIEVLYHIPEFELYAN